MNYSCLIVEDEILIRKNLCKKIAKHPSIFQLMGDAHNGFQALKLIQQTDIIPSLVITDIQMPGMDGLELAEHLYKNHPETQIVILSGFDDFQYAQKAIKYRVCDYLSKPVTDEILNETLLSVKLKLDSLYHIKNGKTGMSSEISSPKDMALHIQSYIRMHYTEDLSLEDLEKEFQFSPAYIRKIFKQYTQHTPSQYLTHLRINEAKRLLLMDHTLSIHTVGNMVGYQDPYYFSRIFKKNTGMYPTEYRSIQFSTKL